MDSVVNLSLLLTIAVGVLGVLLLAVIALMTHVNAEINNLVPVPVKLKMLWLMTVNLSIITIISSIIIIAALSLHLTPGTL